MVEPTKWYYLDLADVDTPQVKYPLAVPFDVRDPRLLGFGVSDSSMKRLIESEEPASYRRPYPFRDEGGGLGRRIRNMVQASTDGMTGSTTGAAVGISSSNAGIFQVWGGK